MSNDPLANMQSMGAAFKGNIDVKMQGFLKNTRKEVEAMFTKTALTAKEMTGALNKSFTGMQGKAGAVQAIIGAAVDLMSIGISKTQKQVGAIAKQFSQGDFAGAIQGIIDMKTQFLDFERLNQPFITAFKPINDMFSVIAGSATQALVASDAFRGLVAKFSDPAFVASLGDLGAKMGTLAANIIAKVDLDRLFTAINSVIDLIALLTGNTPAPPPTQPPGPPGGATYPGPFPQVSGIATEASGSSLNINIQSAGIITDSQLQRAMNQVSRDASMWRF
jgi:hypothetical protein